MKTIKSKKITKAIFAVLVILVLAPSVFAYPPDNAAVLYYKAFMLYEKENGLDLWDYWKGNIESNEKIEQYLKKNRRIINIVLDATRIDHCDWGFDYSQGTEILLPPLHKAREIFVLLAVDARMQTQRGDYRQALDRCMSIYRMARHLNERPIICYLVGAAINAANHRCMSQILSDMPQDIETLTWLRDEIAELDKRPFSIEPSLSWKREAGIISMSPEKIDDLMRSGLEDGPFKEKILKKILEADEQFINKNKAYWNEYMTAVLAAFDLPYPQAYSKLKQLDEKPSKEYSKNPNAILTAACSPTWLRIYNISTRLGSQGNAVKAAIEIYIIKAKTGKMPDALPADLPPDLFSGKTFQYEKTKNGFVLRCQSKDLDKDKAYEYEFKVKK
ncbi:MAG: hypothetical protein GWN67_21460 [Phycisphaerae bacterium]|nr:hypothetical protein [Phycisphaerae bacterium]NIP53121.1 hypothetical protein [Phycisphaerae bacterium]NIS53501.1 hypothetical protein [Phycisphaerae bacterium]NIU09694.1 hypothetical protein [Phycisphaerae bacterium]NIU58850.1 hypothetical protein [Phycisphaerae bacterium]